MPQQEKFATKEDLETVERRLSAKIDANAKKIEENAEKIEANGRKIEANGAKIDANANKIEGNGAKIEVNAEKIDRLIDMVLDNKEEIKKMVTRDEFNRRFDEVINSIDALTRSFSILEQERLAVNQRLDRIEEKLF